MTVEQISIFTPFLAMIGLTLCVWIYMYIRRIHFIQSQDLMPLRMAPWEFAKMSPPEVYNPSDNLKNLFEMPILFYALALFLFVTKQVDGIYLASAWAFVGFRVAHSVVHCTVNIVMVRFVLYLLSSLALWFMAGRAAWAHLFGA